MAPYRDMLIHARDLSNDELLGLCDAWQYELADPETPDAARFLTGDRLRAVRAELERRERLHRLNTGVPSPADTRYQAWRDLAEIVRERVDIVEVFDRAGYWLHDRTAKEAHAACLVCGGTDRLVIIVGPPGRCFCRQCPVRLDVIGAAMSLRQLGFRDAVAWLAEQCSEPVPA